MHRYKFLGYFLLIFLGISFITRSVLLVESLSLMNTNILEIIQVFIVGVFYDIVAYFYNIIPFVIYLFLVPKKIFNHKFHKLLALVIFFSVIYAVVFNGVSEWFFWEEFGKRFNFIAVDYLVYTHEVIQNIRESYPMPVLISIIFLITAVIYWILHKKSEGFLKLFEDESTYKGRFVITLSVLMIPLLSFLLLHKQGVASDVSSNRYNQELSKNGFYSLFSAYRNNELDYDEFYVKHETNEILLDFRQLVGNEMSTFVSNELNNTLRHVKNSGEAISPNVMLVMIESLSAAYMGIYGDNKNLTPHIDELTKKSLFFSNFFATGTRTVRGMEAVVMSVPPTAGRSIVKRPDNHNMFGMGWVFKDKGYDNKFIYAGHGYFDNMNEYFGHNGFKIVDRNSFKEEEISFANVWGVCDEDLYDKSIKEADLSYSQNKPFFSFVMTTSNHRPYTYPDGKIDIPSHTGRLGGVKYTDYAVNEFLKKVKKKPWFNNTLFVFVADHNGGSSGKNDLPLHRYKIPFLIYAPKLVASQNITKVSSQIDLAPTLFSLMHWNYDTKMYGEDILSDTFKPRALIGTYQKLGLYEDGILSILLANKSTKAYKVKNLYLKSNEYEEVEPLKENIDKAMTYYQSASYFYKHKLDRYKTKIKDD